MLIHTDSSGVRTALKATVGALTLVISFAAVAAAQGGKAEPLRIRFAPGRTTATVTGVLGGDADREYVLAARKGQHLRIRLTFTPRRTLTVRAKHPTGVDLPLSADSGHVWSGRLPDDGDYEIWVIRTAGVRTRSRYTMTVTIR